MINTIRNLVKLELAVIILNVIAIYVTESYMPSELQEYLAQEAEIAPTTQELIMLLGLAVVGITYLISLFGLLGQKIWARNAFIYTTLLIFPLCFFIGPQVDHAIGYTLDQISVLIQGMILGLLIFKSSYQESALNKTSNATL